MIDTAKITALRIDRQHLIRKAKYLTAKYGGFFISKKERRAESKR